MTRIMMSIKLTIIYLIMLRDPLRDGFCVIPKFWSAYSRRRTCTHATAAGRGLWGETFNMSYFTMSRLSAQLKYYSLNITHLHHLRSTRSLIRSCQRVTQTQMKNQHEQIFARTSAYFFLLYFVERNSFVEKNIFVQWIHSVQWIFFAARKQFFFVAYKNSSAK